MGFSVGGASAVVFVGLLVSAATLAPAVERAGERRSEASAARAERALDRANTAVTVNATYNATTDELAVRARNTGTRTLDIAATDLLADGRYANATPNVAGAAETALWAPGETLWLNDTQTEKPARVVVVTEGGIAASAGVA